MSICVCAGCENIAIARGWCTKHYTRFRRHGDPETMTRVRGSGAVEERFWIHVDRRGPNECWPWTASLRRGHGKFWDGTRMVPARRYAYELLVGPIPESMDLDHTCHNGTSCHKGDSCPHRRCVNPAHLEPVPRRENIVRGDGPALRRAATMSRTHCKNGHEYTPENTSVRADGTRRCLTCQRAWTNAWYARKIAVNQPS